MEKKKLNADDLTIFRDTMTTIPEVEYRKKIIYEVISNELSLDASGLKKAMKELVVLQNTISSEETISKVSDIKSAQNYSDFITFVEDDKQHFIIGDLHDDLNSFDHILKAINFAENFDLINLVFLGDYVDRGKDRLALINKIILLKYLLPNNIHLLRGNHELYRIDKDGNYVSPMMGANPGSYHFNLLTYLIQSDIEKHIAFTKTNEINKELIELYAKFFDSMPTVALFNFEEIKICTVHGGLPRPNLSVENYFESEDYNSFNKLLDKNTKDSVGIPQKINMIWSDPYDGYMEGFRDSSDVRFSFSKDQFDHFCKKYDIDLVLRAHEAQENGYKSYFDDRLISVFSSGGRNKNSNEIVNQNSYYENVSPNILRIGKRSIVSLNIDFDKNKPQSLEERFKYEDIVKNRENFEKKIVNFSNDIDSKILNSVKSNPEVIQIIDMYNHNNKKLIISKGEKKQFNHSDLQQFFGIHKDTCFEIDQKSKTLTNLGEIELNIGINGTFLKKSEQIPIDTKTIVFINKIGCLGIVI